MVLQKLLGRERKPFLVIGDSPAAAVQIADPQAKAVAGPAAKPLAVPVAEPEKPAGPTTAELLAAERAAEQAAAPPPNLTTFAAELLNPANALARRRRTPGAGLAEFKAMAVSMRR
jgi:hypothetical protein